MTRGTRAPDTTTLRMALVGYEIEKNKIEEKIREVQAALGKSTTPSTGPAVRKRRKLSAAARRKIAEAQRRRWAELKKNAGKK